MEEVALKRLSGVRSDPMEKYIDNSREVLDYPVSRPIVSWNFKITEHWCLNQKKTSTQRPSRLQTPRSESSRPESRSKSIPGPYEIDRIRLRVRLTQCLWVLIDHYCFVLFRSRRGVCKVLDEHSLGDSKETGFVQCTSSFI